MVGAALVVGARSFGSVLVASAWARWDGGADNKGAWCGEGGGGFGSLCGVVGVGKIRVKQVKTR